MPAHSVALLVTCSAVLAALWTPPARRLDSSERRVERVRPNDNRQSAGTMRGRALELRLEARMAAWHPYGDDAPGAPVPAFAEEGGPARIPGPLVRVRAGTDVDVSVRNTLRDTLVVHGLHARTRSGPVDVAPVAIPPGEQRAVRFRLDAPGTYFYWGTTTRRRIDYRTLEDAQLTGAIVVDDPAAGRPRDRVFVLGMWTDTVGRVNMRRTRVLAVINGRSWPHTERLRYLEGDSIRWRVINATSDLHPMHLHGFYFRVDSRGDGQGDTLYAPGAGGMAVTESMGSGGTMSLTWVPERPGNWLFHCHVPEHFGPRGPMGMLPPAHAAGTGHGDHANGGMNGLVVGVEVQAARTAARPSVATADARRLRLLVRPNVGSTTAAPFYGYAIHEGGAEPPVDSGRSQAPPLELVRGRPVRITVVNRLPEPTAVHWHGIELESYFDGVPGFSGAGRRVTPLIAPGDSFEVRFTPPRVGTFIYHTHANEERQQLAGLAGAIVVRESDAPRDAATDVALLISEDSTVHTRRVLVNGHSAPAPLELRAGSTYRFRFIQMAVVRSVLRLELLRDSTLAVWRPVAKDGAELPPSARVVSGARARLGIGETYDVEVTPQTEGDMRLEVRQGLRWPLPARLFTTLPIRVLPLAAGN